MRDRIFCVICAALIAMALMFAGIALAGQSSEESFKSMDKNSDQMLDSNEFAQGYEGTDDPQAAFDAADEDMSGTLDASEWTKYQKAHGIGKYSENKAMEEMKEKKAEDKAGGAMKSE